MSSAPLAAQPLEAPPPKRGGCLQAGLIGCGVVALLLVLCFVGLMLYARRNPGVFLDFAMGQIEKNYGPDVTEDDKRELKASVAQFKEAIRSGRVRRERNFTWQRSFQFRGSRSDKLSHEDVQELIRSFREAAIPAAAPESAPARAPAAARTPSS